MKRSVSLLILLGSVGYLQAGDTPEPLASWMRNVHVGPVLKDVERHSIHAYFNTSPESPDGRYVLLYTSTSPEGYEGEIWIVQRENGKVQVLARNVVVEDTHRAACQQWVSDGRRVVFHDLRDGRWVVVAVDVETGKERILAEDRQVGFGRPDSNLVPIYGPHWNPGTHRNIELVDAETGAIRTAVTVDAVRKAHAPWIAERFGERPVSLFFPLLSPNHKQILFKMASPAGGDFRSKKASDREGLFCADVESGKVVWMNPRWGHPAWSPDSHALINYSSKGLFVTYLQTGQVTYPITQPFPGSHPSFGPDGDLFTTDFQVRTSDEPAGLWGVAVGSLAKGKYCVVHRFDNTQGSTSWRRSHPHPSFSADGKRLYFNVSADRWTRLYVAEVDPK